MHLVKGPQLERARVRAVDPPQALERAPQLVPLQRGPRERAVRRAAAARRRASCPPLVARVLRPRLLAAVVRRVEGGVELERGAAPTDDDVACKEWSSSPRRGNRPWTLEREARHQRSSMPAGHE